jgi:hypothetical protein
MKNNPKQELKKYLLKMFLENKLNYIKAKKSEEEK